MSEGRASLPLRVALCLFGTLAPLPLQSASRGAAARATVTPVEFLFPDVAGWTRGEGHRFGADTLYEHINGASELYLSYGFRELLVADYVDRDGGSLSVEIYRHESPAHAFGIYSQERPREGRYLSVGVEGYLDSTMLNFLNGEAYVKLSADGLGARSDEALRRFAEIVAAALGGPARAPDPLGFFPEEGKRAHSEAFAARDFLGYAFLRAGFSADYVVGAVQFQLFVVDGGTPEASAEMLRRYREAAGVANATEEDAAPDSVVVADPYNGEVALFRGGRFLCGSVRLQDATLRERYLGYLRRSVASGR